MARPDLRADELCNLTEPKAYSSCGVSQGPQQEDSYEASHWIACRTGDRFPARSAEHYDFNDDHNPAHFIDHDTKDHAPSQAGKASSAQGSSSQTHDSRQSDDQNLDNQELSCLARPFLQGPGPN